MSNLSLEKSRVSRGVVTVSAACAVLLFSQLAIGGPNERAQAKRMYDRIAGVPPDEATITAMEALLLANDPVGAALKATDDPAFYNVTLKNLVTPWTNRDMTVFAPLNDYTATVIGMVRDNVAFNTALSADILYTVDAPGLGLPAVSANDNAHYEQAETNGVDLKAALNATTQSAAYGTPTGGTAGLITTRAAAKAFFIDGTNRAMFRFTLINHLCRDMEQVHDTSRPPDRIRQDVSRSPGGDSRVFLNNCIGCHSGMDPMAQAFAYYDYEPNEADESQGRMIYTPGQVNAKYFINSDNFKPGFVTPDDSWENRWRVAQNSVLGWHGAGSGQGAKSLGQELASSDAFAQCQVEKVFKTVCLRAPGNPTDRTQVTQITNDFKNGGYRLKQVFAETASYCKGQ